MKKLKMLLGVIASILVISASGNVYAADEAPPAVSNEESAPAATASRENLLKEGKNLYYLTPKGRKVKNQWKIIDGDYYYFGADGCAVTGGVTFKNNVIFVFGEDHKKIRNKANTIVTVGKHSYYLRTNGGRAATGYIIYKDNLYYASPTGKLYKNRSRENKYYFTASGAAKQNTDALLKIRCMQITSAITNSNMTQSQKLYACWRYVVGGNIHYWSYYPNLGVSGWQRSMALYTLTNRGGNCYGFACAFAALAKEVGYEPYIVYGYVPGSRDGRSDGMTRHCWVQIAGLSYDPEGTYAGWASGIYGTYGYGVYHWTSGSVKFA